jgi:glycosyltransferase involved in cell wall biosynthesis
LRSVLAQDYPADRLEVIVVDGMSRDSTREIVQAISSRDHRLKMLDNPKQNIPAALNIGICAATGKVLMRLDGHSAVPVDYLRSCVEAIGKLRTSTSGKTTAEDSPIAVGGAWRCVGSGFVGRAIALATSSAVGVGNADYRIGLVNTERNRSADILVRQSPRFRDQGGQECPRSDNVSCALSTDTVPFWVIPKTVFERIGLFREEMLCHEDYEFNHRLRKAGGTIFLLPWLKATYFVRSNLRALCHQYTRYGFWKGRFLRSQPCSLKVRHMAPPLLVLTVVTASTMTLFLELGLYLLGAVTLAYITFLFAATLIIGFKAAFSQAQLATNSDSASTITSPSILSMTGIRSAECARPRAQQCPQADPREGDRSLTRLRNVLCPGTGALRARMRIAASALPSILLVPIVLACLHICWGTGVWAGLLRGPVAGSIPRLMPVAGSTSAADDRA